MRYQLAIAFSLLLGPSHAASQTMFIEAEEFTPSGDGWQIRRNAQTRRASRAQTLWGAAGARESTAAKNVTINEPGPYRVWIRHMQHSRWRGPFRLSVVCQGTELAANVFDRELELLDEILPADRSELQQLQPHLYYGRAISLLSPQDRATVDDTRIEVLSVKQSMTPRTGAQVLGSFQDGSPALVRANAGKGTVYLAGYLPGLAYVKAALDHRKQFERQQAEASHDLPEPTEIDPAKAFIDRASSPWHYPAEIRNAILRPVREARVRVPLICSEPLVDAVCMECDKGLLIPLANYALRPLGEIQLAVRSDRPIDRVESAHQGPIKFEPAPDGCIQFRLPLGATDFVKCYYANN